MKILLLIAHSPYLHFLSGLVLVGTALLEAFGLDEATGIGVAHGCFVLGVSHLVQALPHLLEGSEDLEAALAREPEGAERARAAPANREG